MFFCCFIDIRIVFSVQYLLDYPNLKNVDPELLKVKTKHDQLKELQYKSEKNDHDNILKSLKIDNEYYRRKYKSLNQKKSIDNYH